MSRKAKTTSAKEREQRRRAEESQRQEEERLAKVVESRKREQAKLAGIRSDLSNGERRLEAVTNKLRSKKGHSQANEKALRKALEVERQRVADLAARIAESDSSRVVMKRELDRVEQLKREIARAKSEAAELRKRASRTTTVTPPATAKAVTTAVSPAKTAKTTPTVARPPTATTANSICAGRGDGAVTLYYDNFQKKEEGVCQHGAQKGVWTRYDRDGSVTSRATR
jgi:hypothetical protein